MRKTKCDVCGRTPSDPSPDGYATDFFHVDGWPGGTAWEGPWDFCSTRCAGVHFSNMADDRDKGVARSNFLNPHYGAHNRWLRLPFWKKWVTPKPQVPELPDDLKWPSELGDAA